MIRYYWNQCFFFKLKQQPGNKVPYIYQYVDELIKRYIELSGSNLPVWSNKGLAYLARFDYEFFDKRRMKAANVLPVDVAWRLKNVNGTVKNEFYYPNDWASVSTDEFIPQLEKYLVWFRDKRIKARLGNTSSKEYLLEYEKTVQ